MKLQHHQQIETIHGPALVYGVNPDGDQLLVAALWEKRRGCARCVWISVQDVLETTQRRSKARKRKT